MKETRQVQRERHVREVASAAERHWHAQKMQTLADRWLWQAEDADPNRAPVLRRCAAELESLIAERER